MKEGWARKVSASPGSERAPWLRQLNREHSRSVCKKSTEPELWFRAPSSALGRNGQRHESDIDEGRQDVSNQSWKRSRALWVSSKRCVIGRNERLGNVSLKDSNLIQMIVPLASL